MFIIIISILIPICLWILSQTPIFGWFCSLIIRQAKHYRCLRRPKRLILIRHGESQGNQNPKIYESVPDHAISLTEKGREQARRCGEKLRKLIGINETLTCYVSPFRRSKETCEIICKTFPDENVLKIREDPRIREQEWGNFQDLATHEVTATERQKIGRFFYRFKNGESGADVYDRVSSFMDSLFREMDNTLVPNNNILIISHGLFIRLFLMRFYRWSVETFHSLANFQNCEYCVLERDDADGSFVLKTDLKLFSGEKLIYQQDKKENYNEQVFNEETHGSPYTNDVNENQKNNE